MKRTSTTATARAVHLGRASSETKGPNGNYLDPMGKQFAGLSRV
jgi:hypothetical protein